MRHPNAGCVHHDYDVKIIFVMSAVGLKALHDILHISNCCLQSDVKEESLDENYIVISTQI